VAPPRESNVKTKASTDVNDGCHHVNIAKCFTYVAIKRKFENYLRNTIL